MTLVTLNETGPHRQHRFAAMLLAGQFTTEAQVMEFLGLTVRYLLLNGRKDVVLSYLDRERMSLTPADLLDGVVPAEELEGSVRLLGSDDSFRADHIVTLVLGTSPDDNGELVDAAVIRRLGPGNRKK